MLFMIVEKNFYEGPKESLPKKNQDEKEVAIEKLKTFRRFKASRIRRWNISRQKKILRIQRLGKKLGPVTGESEKEIKIIWAGFSFFHNKNLFFKELMKSCNQPSKS